MSKPKSVDFVKKYTMIIVLIVVMAFLHGEQEVQSSFP